MNGRRSTDPRTTRSLKHAVRDGVAYSVMSGAGENYFSAYALFLGASAAQISLLAALPPLLGALAQFVAACLSVRLGGRRGLILVGALLHALTWIPLIWLPHLLPEYAVPILVGCLVLYHVWLGLGASLWSSLVGDLVPERRRGRFFAGRTRLMSATHFSALIVAGFILHLFEVNDDARLGFWVIFGVAAVARIISVYELSRMHEPGLVIVRLSWPALPALWARLKGSHFAYFSLFIGSFSFAVSIAAPFFIVYMLKDLKFSYLEFTALTAVSVITQFFTLRLWGRVSDVLGNRLVLIVAGSLVPLTPALWLVSSNFVYLVFVQALGGLAWAGFSLAAGNYLYDIVPRERRSHYGAMHSVFNGVGALLGAVLGGALATRIPAESHFLGHAIHASSGLWAVLLFSALFRALIVVAFLPHLAELRPVRRLSRETLVHVLRNSPAAGRVRVRAPRGQSADEVRRRRGGSV